MPPVSSSTNSSAPPPMRSSQQRMSSQALSTFKSLCSFIIKHLCKKSTRGAEGRPIPLRQRLKNLRWLSLIPGTSSTVYSIARLTTESTATFAILAEESTDLNFLNGSKPVAFLMSLMLSGIWLCACPFLLSKSTNSISNSVNSRKWFFCLYLITVALMLMLWLSCIIDACSKKPILLSDAFFSTFALLSLTVWEMIFLFITINTQNNSKLKSVKCSIPLVASEQTTEQTTEPTTEQPIPAPRKGNPKNQD